MSAFLMPVAFIIPCLLLGGMFRGLLYSVFMTLLSLTDTVLYSSVFCFAVAVFYMLGKNTGKLSYLLKFGFFAVTGTYIPYGLSFMIGRDILSQNERWAFGMLILTMVLFILQSAAGLLVVDSFETPIRHRLAKIIMYVLASAYTVTGVVRYAWGEFPIYEAVLACYTLLWLACVLYLWFECCYSIEKLREKARS